MRVVLHTDPAAFAAVARGWLETQPISASILLAQLDAALHTEQADPDARWVVCHADDGAVIGAAMQTLPHQPFLPRLPPGAGAAIATALLADGQRLTGVGGDPDAVDEFADAWLQAGAGTSSEIATAMRVYRLERLIPPVDVEGGPRVAATDDRGLLTRWLEGFRSEARPESPPGAVPGLAEHLVADGLALLWEVDGTPVSVAARSRPIAGVARIAPVYTPPERRRRGYGSAVTAAASRACLDDGASTVILYTDLANPTANTIYQQIGFRPVHDARERWLG